jgi:hypothetical protein
MTKTINRRTALAGTAALASFAPLPLKAAGSDAELYRLFAAYVEAEERDYAAYSAWDEARGKAMDIVGFGDRKPNLFTDAEIEELEALVDKQCETMGFSHLKAASEAANETRIDLWAQIENTPAQSVTGVALKLAAVMLWDDGLKDVWTGRDQGEQGDSMFLAARADAMRLAGLPHTFGTDEPESEYVEADTEA